MAFIKIEILKASNHMLYNNVAEVVQIQQNGQGKAPPTKKVLFFIKNIVL